MPEASSAKLIIEVVAGLLPGGTPEDEYTRRYVITSDEWTKAGSDGLGQARLLAERNGEAQGYAAWLMMQPDYLNWVRVDWVWM